MERGFYDELAQAGLQGDILSDELCLHILTSSAIELLPLLDAAYQVRKKYTGNEVQLHIINNAQNGYCPKIVIIALRRSHQMLISRRTQLSPMQKC